MEGMLVFVPTTVEVAVRTPGEHSMQSAVFLILALCVAVLTLACIVAYTCGWHNATESRDRAWRDWLDGGDVEVPPDAPLGGAPGWPEDSHVTTEPKERRA